MKFTELSTYSGATLSPLVMFGGTASLQGLSGGERLRNTSDTRVDVEGRWLMSEHIQRCLFPDPQPHLPS